jgi:exosortase
MRTADRWILAGLVLAGLWIWLREPGAAKPLDETLPLLAALPLLAWFGAPWNLPAASVRLHRPSLAAAGLALVVGVVTGLQILLAAAWTALLWAWLQPRLTAEARVRVGRLLPLAILAFPWLSYDFPSLAWWYRLSAAWSVEQLFQLADLAVHREGTQLFIQQMPFDVTPACSGIKTLQALLVAGTALCFLQVGRRPFYWLTLLALPLVAWLANTLRVLAIIVAALTLGPESVEGWLHFAGGWVVLMVMFALTGLGLEVLRRLQPRRPSV